MLQAWKIKPTLWKAWEACSVARGSRVHESCKQHHFGKSCRYFQVHKIQFCLCNKIMKPCAWVTHSHGLIAQSLTIWWISYRYIDMPCTDHACVAKQTWRFINPSPASYVFLSVLDIVFPKGSVLRSKRRNLKRAGTVILHLASIETTVYMIHRFEAPFSTMFKTSSNACWKSAMFKLSKHKKTRKTL